jgi:hypothetical protein
MKRLICFASFVLALCLASAPARSSECIDVLKTLPDLKESDFSSKDFYFQHRIWTSTTTSEKEENEDAKIGVVIEGIPISVGDSRHIKGKLSKSEHDDTTIVADSERRLVLYNSAAQSEAIKSWRSCMERGSGGILVRFEPEALDPSGKLVKLLITYPIPSMGDGAVYKNVALLSSIETTLQNAGVKFPNEKNNQTPQCLLTRIYKPRDTICDLALEVPSRRTQIDLTLFLKNADGTKFTASAYLPPRPVLKYEVRDWPAIRTEGSECGTPNSKYRDDPKAACVQNGSNSGSAAAHSNERRKADDGFVFIKSTIKCDLVQSRTNNGACKIELHNSGDEITIDVTMGSWPGGSKGPAPGDNVWVNGHVTAKEVRPYWDWGDGTKTPVQPTTAKQQ